MKYFLKMQLALHFKKYIYVHVYNKKKQREEMKFHLLC